MAVVNQFRRQGRATRELQDVSIDLPEFPKVFDFDPDKQRRLEEWWRSVQEVIQRELRRRQIS